MKLLIIFPPRYTCIHVFNILQSIFFVHGLAILNILLSLILISATSLEPPFNLLQGAEVSGGGPSE